MLDRHPDLAVVIDHGAKPDIANGMWEPWARSMRVGGRQSSGTLQAGPVWRRKPDPTGRSTPCAHTSTTLLDCFGAQRLMWGSDWPVVNLGSSYQRWFAASVALLDGLTPQERAAIMGGTARKFYGL